MSEASDPSFSTTETLIGSLRNDLGQMSQLLGEAATYAREAQATLWEIDRRMKIRTTPCIICNGTGRRSGPPRNCGACNGTGR